MVLVHTCETCAAGDDIRHGYTAPSHERHFAPAMEENMSYRAGPSAQFSQDAPGAQVNRPPLMHLHRQFKARIPCIVMTCRGARYEPRGWTDGSKRRAPRRDCLCWERQNNRKETNKPAGTLRLLESSLTVRTPSVSCWTSQTTAIQHCSTWARASMRSCGSECYLHA